MAQGVGATRSSGRLSGAEARRAVRDALAVVPVILTKIELWKPERLIPLERRVDQEEASSPAGSEGRHLEAVPPVLAYKPAKVRLILLPGGTQGLGNVLVRAPCRRKAGGLRPAQSLRQIVEKQVPPVLDKIDGERSQGGTGGDLQPQPGG